LQGALDRSLETAWQAVEAAGRLDRVASLCGALAELCVVSMWISNLEVLAEATRRLTDVTRRYGLHFWRTHALVGQGVLAASRQDGETAGGLFDAVLDEARFDLTYPSLTGALADSCAAIGRSEQAWSLVNRALQRPGAFQRWSAPHLLVIRGNLRREEPSAATDFAQALQLAHQQEALLLELRAADGLARLAARSGDVAEALATLGGLYARFTEGRDTPHLRAARATLAELR
jgi:hypothetical protein